MLFASLYVMRRLMVGIVETLRMSNADASGSVCRAPMKGLASPPHTCYASIQHSSLIGATSPVADPLIKVVDDQERKSPLYCWHVLKKKISVYACAANTRHSISRAQRIEYVSANGRSTAPLRAHRPSTLRCADEFKRMDKVKMISIRLVDHN